MYIVMVASECVPVAKVGASATWCSDSVASWRSAATRSRSSSRSTTACATTTSGGCASSGRTCASPGSTATSLARCGSASCTAASASSSSRTPPTLLRARNLLRLPGRAPPLRLLQQGGDGVHAEGRQAVGRDPHARLADRDHPSAAVRDLRAPGDGPGARRAHDPQLQAPGIVGENVLWFTGLGQTRLLLLGRPAARRLQPDRTEPHQGRDHLRQLHPRPSRRSTPGRRCTRIRAMASATRCTGSRRSSAGS